MLLGTWLDKGNSIPSRNTLSQRFCSYIGYKIAKRNKNVYIHKSCLISPEAKINPRDGEIKLNKKCTVASGAILQGNVEMGENCSVQAYSVLVGYGTPDDREGAITIGNNVRIAPHVMIIGGNHVFDDSTKLIIEQGLHRKSIVIEDDVWIAGRVNIMAGVTIGEGSIIGAGSVVTKDIPPYSVAVGVPAKIIKQRK